MTVTSRFQPSKSWVWIAGILAGHLLAAAACGQKLNVRTERGPFYAGEPLTIEVDAIDFESQPEIRIDGSQQPDVQVNFRNAGRSESTQIYQSGGKLVRQRTVKTTLVYQVLFEAPGEYRLGPFETEVDGQTITHPAIRFEVRDVDVTDDMRVEIILPEGNIYPGQKVPVKLRWLFAGNPRQVRGLTIRSSLFDRFRFVDDPASARGNMLPLTTAKGIENFPAEFTTEQIDGREFLVGTIQRTFVPDQPEVVDLAAPFVSFRKVVGTTRSGDIFDSLFESRVETIPLRGTSSPIRFEIKPFPSENQPASFDGAVGQGYRITTSLNRTSLRTGDPLTLQVNIEGQGNLDSIGLPDLAAKFPAEDFEWPEGEIAGVTDDQQKQFRVSLKIKNENVTEIPPLEFSWFDPRRGEYETVTSAPIPIEVKPGEVVTSADVFSSARPADSARDEPSPGRKASIDLSIETDPDRLLESKGSAVTLSWILYLSGLGMVGVAWAWARFKRTDRSGNRVQRSVQKCVQQIRRLDEDQLSCGELAAKLRELQVLLRESWEARTGTVRSGDAGWQGSGLIDELDRLIGRCDAIAFRPDPATREERNELLQSARELAARVQMT